QDAAARRVGHAAPRDRRSVLAGADPGGGAGGAAGARARHGGRARLDRIAAALLDDARGRRAVARAAHRRGARLARSGRELMRGRVAAPSIVSVALLSCGPPRAGWQPRLDLEGPAAYAVVWLGSPLRTRPDVRAPIVDLAAGVAREPWARGALASFRVRRSR